MYSVSEVNGVKIYNMSAGKTTPEFYEEARKTSKSLKYNQDFRRRIELVQDFQFEVACSQVETTEDQRYIVCTGTYAPQLKIFDTSELSLKCLRGIDSEAVKFTMISQDYSKIAVAEIDRTIELHAQYGTHFKTRIPHFPRDITYNPFNANLLVSASANAIYRISLEQGKFLLPFETKSNINTMCYNRYLNLLFAGGDSLQVWDFRERKAAVTIQTSSQVYSTQCDSTGLLVAAGQEGVVDLLDVRMDRKLSSINHPYMEPVVTVDFYGSTKKIISSTNKQIRITSQEGKLFTSVEPEFSINRFSVVPETGLILTAHDAPRIGCYFIPELGPAPKWIPYLENVTEQLEETQKSMVYDEFRFITEQELYDLQATNLVGTKLLKPHLHGYLMHLKLYNKLQDKKQAHTFSYEEYKREKAEEHVNSEMPVRIDFKDNKEEEGQAIDERFAKKMKGNSAFSIDKYSEQFMLRHPHMKKQLMQEKAKQDAQLERSLKIKKFNKGGDKKGKARKA